MYGIIVFKNNFDSRSSLFVYYSWYFAAAWTLVIVALLLFGIIQIRSVQEAMVKQEAQANFSKDQALRFWSTIHGGVYVPVDDDTQPNPHLMHVKDRDIITPSGKSLTLMNPAYMIRQTMKQFEDLYGIRGHLTSLQYFRPETAPDEWEKSALREFEKGAKEIFDYSDIEGKPYYRYMAPMITKEGCLKCHGHQGYKVGDVRGGVSVSVPMAPYLANQRRQSIVWTFSLGFLWLIGFIGIKLMAHALSRRIREKDQAEIKLQKAHDGLEKKVQERTASLYKEIKARKEIELALKDAEAKYRSIFEYAKSGIAVYKAIDGGKDFIFKDLNKKGEKIDNVNRKDIIGNRVSKMFPNVKDFGLLDAFQRVWETGKAEDFPLTFYEDKRITGWRDNFIYKLPSGEIAAIYRDETNRKQIEEQRDKLISELQKALSEVKKLSRLLPICSHCKNIRNDKGYWEKIESYIHKHSDTEFSHGICPECAKKYYPDLDLYDE